MRIPVQDERQEDVVDDSEATDVEEPEPRWDEEEVQGLCRNKAAPVSDTEEDDVSLEFGEAVLKGLAIQCSYANEKGEGKWRTDGKFAEQLAAYHPKRFSGELAIQK